MKGRAVHRLGSVFLALILVAGLNPAAGVAFGETGDSASQAQEYTQGSTSDNSNVLDGSSTTAASGAEANTSGVEPSASATAGASNGTSGSIDSADSAASVTEDAGTVEGSAEGASGSAASSASNAEGKHQRAASASASKAPASTFSTVYVNASAGDDNASGTTADTAVKTLSKALELVADGGTIHTSGSFTQEGDLAISKNVTFDGGGSANFLTLASGTLTASGKTVNWNNYGTALTISTGAVLGDGDYAFTNVNTGVKLSGMVKGSSRDALHLSVTANNEKVGIDTQGSGLKYQNATVDWNGGGAISWTYRSLYMDNCTFNVSDVWLFSSAGQPFNVQNSDLTVSGRFSGNSWNGGHVMSVYQDVPAYFTNSNVTIVGSRINVVCDKGLYIDNSTVTIKDSPDGGINVNYGSSLHANDSTLKAENVSRGFIAAGASGSSNFYVTGSSVIETPAASQADSVGVNGEYSVTGGTFKVNAAKLSDSRTVPTNGNEHGNEKLTLFTLADSSTDSLDLIDKNGNTYSYPVAKANSDGSKNVWAPAATVTYSLNDGNATFADGTAADKTFTAMRGQLLSAADGYVNSKGVYTHIGFADPGTPTDANGVEFLGWYYKDAQGGEQKFDPATIPVTGNLQVYAKWRSKTVVYHNGDGAKHVVNLDPSAASATVLSFDEVNAATSGFTVPGKTFKNWTLAEDGSNAVNEGDVLAFDGDETQIDLYAQYTDNLYTIKFSANGGTFSDGSVFKNTDYFTIEKDAEGGDVAVLKQQATYGQTLHDVTEELGLAYSAASDTYLEVDANAALDGYKLADTEQWATDADGNGSIRFDSYNWIITWNGENPTITSDVTYYLKWQSAASSENTIVDNGLSIPADMWGADKAESAKVGLVRTGDTFSLTGMVDTQGIKDQMAGIEEQFGQTEADFSNIKLTRARSTFNVTLTLPKGVVVPSNPQIEVNGLGDLFEVTNTSVKGRQVTITMTLKDGIDTYKKLKDAVDSTGTQQVSAQPALLSAFQSLLGVQSQEASDHEITATVNGLTLDEDAVSNGQILSATGTVDGHFEATASTSSVSKFFSFDWKGKQTEEGADEAATNASDIQYSFQVVKPYTSTLQGDILVGSDTEHSQTYQVLPGEKVDFTGALNMKSILEQMNAIENDEGTGESSYSSIALEDTECTFVATFTVPEGMSIPDNVQATAADFGPWFSIEKTEVDGNKATVTMKLNADGIDNYQQLKKAVEAAGDEDGWMHVTIPGVQLSQDLQPGDKLTVSGQVGGTMKSTATLNGNTKHFEFEWNGIQWPNGADALTPDTQGITFTCEVPSPVQESLPGDMLVRDADGLGVWDSEHEQVFTATQGETLDYAGALDVTKIKDQMKGIEQQFLHSDASDIAVDIKNFDFTATVTFPEGIVPPESISADEVGITEGFGSGFKVNQISVEGQTVTVKFGLADPESIDTYAKLRDTVNAAGDDGNWMYIIIPGVKVASDAAVDDVLTASGTVDGSFEATATSKVSGKRMVFSFNWTGTQWPDGADAIQNADDTGIQLSVDVNEADIEAPDSGSTPSSDSDDPDNRNTGVSPATEKPDNTGGGSGTSPASDNSGDSGSAGGSSYNTVVSLLPQTGDTAPMLVIAIVAAGALAVGIASARRRKDC
ncbi:MAG: LPXTG cell wall anchor domain-containing protein [Eggerthellaceae bacterium]|jgi:LPXTG-motif cell wall-anchored protein